MAASLAELEGLAPWPAQLEDSPLFPAAAAPEAEAAGGFEREPSGRSRAAAETPLAADYGPEGHAHAYAAEADAAAAGGAEHAELSVVSAADPEAPALGPWPEFGDVPGAAALSAAPSVAALGPEEARAARLEPEGIERLQRELEDLVAARAPLPTSDLPVPGREYVRARPPRAPRARRASSSFGAPAPRPRPRPQPSTAPAAAAGRARRRRATLPFAAPTPTPPPTLLEELRAFYKADEGASPELFTNTALLRRESIRFAPRVATWSLLFLRAADSDCDGRLVWREFLPYGLAAYKALHSTWDERRARAVCAEDWEHDRGGKGYVGRGAFTLSLFQLADTWTEGIDEGETLDFIEALFGSLVKYDAARGRHTVRSLAEVRPGEAIGRVEAARKLRRRAAAAAAAAAVAGLSKLSREARLRTKSFKLRAPPSRSGSMRRPPGSLSDGEGLLSSGALRGALGARTASAASASASAAESDGEALLLGGRVRSFRGTPAADSEAESEEARGYRGSPLRRGLGPGVGGADGVLGGLLGMASGFLGGTGAGAERGAGSDGSPASGACTPPGGGGTGSGPASPALRGRPGPSPGSGPAGSPFDSDWAVYWAIALTPAWERLALDSIPGQQQAGPSDFRSELERKLSHIPAISEDMYQRLCTSRRSIVSVPDFELEGPFAGPEAPPGSGPGPGPADQGAEAAAGSNEAGRDGGGDGAPASPAPPPHPPPAAAHPRRRSALRSASMRVPRTASSAGPPAPRLAEESAVETGARGAEEAAGEAEGAPPPRPRPPRSLPDRRPSSAAPAAGGAASPRGERSSSAGPDDSADELGGGPASPVRPAGSSASLRASILTARAAARALYGYDASESEAGEGPEAAGGGGGGGGGVGVGGGGGGGRPPTFRSGRRSVSFRLGADPAPPVPPPADADADGVPRRVSINIDLRGLPSPSPSSPLPDLVDVPRSDSSPGSEDPLTLPASPAGAFGRVPSSKATLGAGASCSPSPSHSPFAFLVSVPPPPPPPALDLGPAPLPAPPLPSGAASNPSARGARPLQSFLANLLQKPAPVPPAARPSSASPRGPRTVRSSTLVPTAGAGAAGAAAASSSASGVRRGLSGLGTLSPLLGPQAAAGEGGGAGLPTLDMRPASASWHPRRSARWA